MATADTAVVTGASSGIGEAIAAALLARGVPVVTLQRSPLKLKHKDLPFPPDRPHRSQSDARANERSRRRVSRALSGQQCRRERAQSAGEGDGRGAQLRHHHHARRRHGADAEPAVMPGPVETAQFTRGHPVGSHKRQTVIDKILVGRVGTPLAGGE